MNIFAVHNDPYKAAFDLCDAHVRKMIIESAQMLANAYPIERLSQPDCPKTQKGKSRRHSYLHHPCSKWVLKSYNNWLWLLHHAQGLCDEYQRRYNKEHFTSSFIRWCQLNKPAWLPQTPQTDFALAMPDEYKTDCPVLSYRKYYVGDKLSIATWKNTDKPIWIEEIKK